VLRLSLLASEGGDGGMKGRGLRPGCWRGEVGHHRRKCWVGCLSGDRGVRFEHPSSRLANW